MNTKALNSLADLICRAQEQDRTPMGIAFAIDAAGRHMSPEMAAELERLRARVTELEAWKTADDKVRPHRMAIANSNLHYIGKLELRIRRARVLHLKHSDSEHCQHDGAAWPCPTVAALEAAVGEAVHPCGCPKRFGRHADGCPTEAARKSELTTGDTLPAWLYQRFMPEGESWDRLDSGQREYWEHQARAVRRAVGRGGFKADGITRRIAPTQALTEGDEEDVSPQVQKLRGLLAGQRAAVEDPHDGPLHHTYRVSRDLPELGGGSC